MSGGLNVWLKVSFGTAMLYTVDTYTDKTVHG